MKIGVISDTHIPHSADSLPASVLAYFSDVDHILHAGDLVCYKVYEEFSQLAPTTAVAGNMDDGEVRSHLSSQQIVELGGFKIGLIHGWGPRQGLENRVLSKFTDVDVICFGHSHRATCIKRDGILLFNPGSATDLMLPNRSIGILTLGDTIDEEIIYLD